VHLAGQDIAGGALYRLATDHPADVRSLIATEMGSPASAWKVSGTSPTAARGTSVFWPLPASRGCCSPVGSMTSSARGRSRP
jgi:hypothetical protein